MNNLFSFDIGTNSIGWAVLALGGNGDPERITDAGVRIFSDGRDPKSKASLAEARRMARAMSRRRDRTLRRKRATLRTLAEIGLMPDTSSARQALLRETSDPRSDSGQPSRNPYALRALALEEKLPLFNIGRALYHLGQRRGFKSNRKTDRKDNDKGKIALGIDELRAAMHRDRSRTYGEWLARRHALGQAVRLRSGALDLEGEGYAFYPERTLLEDEFHRIWEAQASHYPDILTPERRDHLFKVMFFQRPLKKPQVSNCPFNTHEKRLSKAHPLFQEFRLYKEVNELEIVEPDLTHKKLTLDQRNALVTKLQVSREASFTGLRTVLKLRPDQRLNKESESRTKLKGNEVYALLSDKTRFGPRWGSISQADQWAIIERLKEEEDPVRLFEWLRSAFGIEGEQAEAIASVHLPDGHGRLGQTALKTMLVELKAEVIPEAEAAKRCSYDHARLGGGRDEGEDELPPYQEILQHRIPPGTNNPDDPYDIEKGRFTNPTVHIALNQLRHVMNALIGRYGKPAKIAVELARDLKLSERQKEEVNRTIARNTRDAERRGKTLEEHGIPNTGYNRTLVRLWEDLNPGKPEDRCCIYSGKPISISMLFSGEVDIDHILPWSRTLDDSHGNKLLCLREANRVKRNRAPAEVTEWQDHYDEILSRAARLPQNKRDRFAPDAMQRFEKEGGFLARQLTDTQYLSRMALEYLACLFPAEEADEAGELKRRNHIRVSPGRLTEMLRRNWGLNSILADSMLGETAQEKNRKDHRHHAIDAIVVGVTGRSLLNRISNAAGRLEAQQLETLVKEAAATNKPWEGFREDVATAVRGIIVSHKPDHGTAGRKAKDPARRQTAGRLHNDTAYGLTGETDARGNTIVVRRKPFLSLTSKDIPSIRDEALRAVLEQELRGIPDGKAFQAALDAFRKKKGFHHYHGIRHVRLTEPLSVIGIRDRDGRVYKGYKGDANQRYDVWETLDGKWHAEVVSMFDAHQPGWQSRFHAENPTARRVLRLQQDDMVALNAPDGERLLVRVVKFRQNGQITFAAHNESGNLKARDATSNEQDPFKYISRMASSLKDSGCRQIRIDATGRVFDPGPQDRASKLKKQSKR
ncbi:MAG: type II CRISPR RNA-guided endonuclease Cas9 [Pannonibacter sp.]